MQVEVNVEQRFLQADSQAIADSARGISPQTWQGWFERWLEVLQPELSPTQTYELSLRLTNDQEIQALNAQYRHQDRPTDVLAFAALEVAMPQAEAWASDPVYLGDLVISVETAQRQALEHQKSLEAELCWLATHGLLHLLGWDHPDEESLGQMLEQQHLLLQALWPNKMQQIDF